VDGEEAETQRRHFEGAVKSAGAQSAAPRIDLMRFRAIYKLWPDFPVQSQIYKSVATIKSDAAFRSFAAAGSEIVWAVIDSGIDGTHPHFQSGHPLDSPEGHDPHRCFVASQSTIAGVPFIAPAPASPEALRHPPEGASQADVDAFLAKRRELIDEHRERALT